jgi:hypothetical protein
MSFIFERLNANSFFYVEAAVFLNMKVNENHNNI